MTTPAHVRGKHAARIGDSALSARLNRELEGEVLFDAFSRGRYATDASIYQIEPIGVVVPRSTADIRIAMDIARDEGIPLLPRGGGTSQCGQTVGEALVVDVSKHLNRLIDFDPAAQRASVEPGMVLDHLNAAVRSQGLWFPVDVSTSSRATIGGMTGNNSCGARSIRYGTMRDNVRAIDALLMDGSAMHFGEIADNATLAGLDERQAGLAGTLLQLGQTEAAEIRKRFPDVMRRVGGYNIDALLPNGVPKGAWGDALVTRAQSHPNLAHLLVGSEGTLGFSTEIHLDLQPLPTHKVLGVCHFPTFYQAMDATQHIVKLGPAAVELVDRNMINLAREIPLFKATVDAFVDGQPDAILLVEFAGDDRATQLRDLARLVELMADLGFPGGVVEAIDPEFQKAVWEVRKSGLNIMMSMKGDGKPISFIEDCAVRLEDLADFTQRLTEVFHQQNTEGTWYAHASVGCLHVRPIVNLKGDVGPQQMRIIAERAFEMVREYKGSHSGEHGDGLVRSEFHEAMFGPRMVALFGQVKAAFDPTAQMNPGKIVDPPKMDDRSLFRFKPGYRQTELQTGLDWSEWGSFASATEMCNNNGACRKRDAGVMCPSFRVTNDEKHLTRGRANSLRLALSGQLGAAALTSNEMRDTMQLCVGCKGCKRECPTGVDMARMKTEFLYQYHKHNRLRTFDRLVAYLPRYAAALSKVAWLPNLRDRLPGAAKVSEWLFGFSAQRSLPRWSATPFQQTTAAQPDPDLILWADTFSRYFEPDQLDSALRVLKAAGYRVQLAEPSDGGRALCCGRTFLASGLIDQARIEARRVLDSFAPYLAKGIPVVGLEPSCLLTLRDEFKALYPGPESDALAANAFLIEEFLARELDAGRLQLPLKAIAQKQALLHGHCHQKAFAVMGSVEKVLGLVPGLSVKTIESSCCGMAGAFGYGAATIDISKRMAEQSLLPAVRAADADTLIVADGTSCRHQIADGAARQAVHVIQVLDQALSPAGG
ncbi:MAG: FAD-binding oxidoreductase [Rhodospirillales bacterium]|nr:FAD-binding oxidoreductase [Rhodospirillales bacterium]